MNKPNVIEMIRPFDPNHAAAEDQYDTVVRRLNRIRARRHRLGEEYTRLETQFVENDLFIASGPKRGETLSKAGRRRRLRRLIEIGADLRELDEQESFSVAALDRMNEALDRWARDTYSPQEAPR
jgi:hypothetical protein